MIVDIQGKKDGRSKPLVTNFRYPVLFFALASLLLAGCDLDTRSIPPWTRAEVHPALVCPGDFVTVDWEMTTPNEGCLGASGVGVSAEDDLRDCRGYTQITSSPDVFVPPAPSDQLTGTEFVSVSSMTTFTFNGHQDGLDWQTEVRTVDVLAEFAVTTVSALFEGVCSGRSPAWTPVEVIADSSEFVQVEGICNLNGFPVRVNSSAHGRSVLLNPSDCTSELDGKPGTLSAFPEGISPLVTEADCSPTRAIPPASLQLEVGLRCSTGSASEAIVAGTPEATDEGPATFVTNTPPPVTPTIALIEINFNADTYTLVAGECTRLRWEVEHAETVTLDGVHVPALEAEQVCPPATTAYKMVAVNPAETVERFVTIEVTIPVTPPDAPANLVAIEETCDSQNYTVRLEWTDNSDNEDGFHIYYGGARIDTVGPNVTSWVYDPPLNLEAQFKVEAFNAAGKSAQISVVEDGCVY